MRGQMVFYGATRRATCRRGLAGVLAALVCLLVFAGSALSARAHEFSKAIKPEGANTLKEPTGVAVNETSGDVYVVDKGNNRVEYFSSAGAYLGQFNGSEAPTGAFSAPEAIAVDNSCVGGALECADPSVLDVYVVDTGHHVIDKFSPTGTYIGQITEAASASFGSLGSAVVDGSGRLWLCEAGGINSVTVDTFSNAQTNEFLSSKKTGAHGASASPICAVNAQDDLYLDNGESLVEYGSGGALIVPPIDEEPVSGIAIDLGTNGLYVDEISAVSLFSPAGAPLEHLAVPGGHGSGVAVNSATDTLYVADSAADVVDVYPPAQLPPVIESESATGITEHDATLNAKIDTHDRYTGYWLQIDTNSSYNFERADCPFELPGYAQCESITEGEPLPTGLVEPQPEYIPAGSGDQAVSLDLASIGAILQPGTTYHYRVIASSGGAPVVVGADQTFATPKGVEEEGWFKKFAEENAKKVAEEAASREAAANQEAAAKKHQEEATAAAAAAQKKHEEEAASKPPAMKTVTPKVLTKAQKLAKALKVCKKEPKRKQAGCEKQAKKKYGGARKKR
jgi:hypothetical protein